MYSNWNDWCIMDFFQGFWYRWETYTYLRHEILPIRINTHVFLFLFILFLQEDWWLWYFNSNSLLVSSTIGLYFGTWVFVKTNVFSGLAFSRYCQIQYQLQLHKVSVVNWRAIPWLQEDKWFVSMQIWELIHLITSLGVDGL